MFRLLRVINFRRLKLADLVARMEEIMRAVKILTVKPTGKRPLGRFRPWWEDFFKWVVKKWVFIRGIGLIRFRIGIIRESL